MTEMEFLIPESIRELVKQCVDQCPGDSERAADSAIEAVKKHPEFEAFRDAVWQFGVRRIANDYRHLMNVVARRKAGVYGQAAKVTLSDAAVEVARRSILNYSIGGRAVGTLTGEELPALRDEEVNKARGCEFNGRFLSALIPLVKGQKMVRECVSEKKAQSLFDQCADDGGGRKKAG